MPYGEVILKKGDAAPGYGVFVPEYRYREKEAEILEGNLCANELDLSRHMRNTCNPNDNWTYGLIGATLGLVLGVIVHAVSK